MRRWMIPVGIVIALLVAIHYAPWHWSNTGNRHHQAKATMQSGGQTCGRVANVYHDTRDGGQPTFVDLGHDYPRQDFTIVIWQHDLGRFDPLPSSWTGKRICVSGQVKIYKGRPEIIASSPGQIQFPDSPPRQ